MEENIKEIIFRNFCKSDGTHYESAAKEIADHMEEFIKWFADNVQTDRNISPFYFIYESTGVKGQFSIAELYSYWNEHINNEKS